MRSVLGYSVFVIGLVFMIQAFFPGALSPSFSVSAPFTSLSPSQADPAQTTTIAKNVQASRVSSFSPGQQLGDGPASSLDFVAFFSSQFAALKPTPANARSAAGEVAARDVALGPWRSAVVTLAADTSSPVVPKAAAPLDSRSRAALAREIQAELKRVGCYGGAIDGSWGTASKRAMVAFIERVNASLPLGEPDDILLLLVKSHAPGTCGISCPVGQSPQNNRCVPDAILAHAGKQVRPAAEPPRTTLVASAASRTTSDATNVLPASPVQPARDGWPLPGRMSIGGPSLDRTLDRTAAAPSAPVPANPSRLAYTVAADGAPGTVDEGQVNVENTAITEMPNPDLTAKPKAVSRSKESNGSNRKNRYGGDGRYRAVQHLFEHPLGRM